MKNSAQLLHAQLTAWNKETTATHARALDGSSAEKVWKQHRICLMHLDEIERFISNKEKLGSAWIGASRGEFSSWVKAVFAFPNGWNHRGKPLSDASLNQLLSLGGLMEQAAEIERTSVSFNPEYRDELSEYISEIRKESELPGPGFSPQLKQHLDKVLDHVEWCLQNFSAVGDIELSDAIRNLLGALGLLHLSEQDQTGEKTSRWRVFFDKLLLPTIQGALGSAAGDAITGGFNSITS